MRERCICDLRIQSCRTADKEKSLHDRARNAVCLGAPAHALLTRQPGCGIEAPAVVQNGAPPENQKPAQSPRRPCSLITMYPLRWVTAPWMDR